MHAWLNYLSLPKSYKTIIETDQMISLLFDHWMRSSSVDSTQIVKCKYVTVTSQIDK